MKRDQKFEVNIHHSITSPRNRKRQQATVEIKLNIANSSADSKYTVVSAQIPYKMINAITLITMVSTAKRRSITVGPDVNRQRFISSASDTAANPNIKANSIMAESP